MYLCMYVCMYVCMYLYICSFKSIKGYDCLSEVSKCPQEVNKEIKDILRYMLNRKEIDKKITARRGFGNDEKIPWKTGRSISVVR